MASHLLRGGCHCGALEVELQTDLATSDIGVRACQCPFCRLHGALSASDPKGNVTFRVRDPDALVRYRFGLKLADFLLCKRCGGYVGAYMEENDRGYAVVNINALGERDRFRAPQAMSYDGETVEQRLARRRERWMPARLETGMR
jgi:hypothetical protein